MKFEIKPISHEGVAHALEKAERYRLLNEPEEAESICRDVLAVEPDNQEALIILLLALTDQFNRRIQLRLKQAQEVLERLTGEYDRAYYEGIIFERRAKAQLRRGSMGSGSIAFQWVRRAMDLFEKARALSPPDNDDALLRWNACVRTIQNYQLQASPDESFEPMLE